MPTGPLPVKSALVVQTPVDSPGMSSAGLAEAWDQEMRNALAKLTPDGALTGATRELQAGLGA